MKTLSKQIIELRDLLSGTEQMLDFRETTAALRELRTLCTKSSQFQNEICNDGFIPTAVINIINFVLSNGFTEEVWITLLRVSLQFLVNLVVNNEYTRKNVWQLCSCHMPVWFKMPDESGRNYACALYYNLTMGNQNILDFIQNKDLIHSAIENSVKGSEYSQFILEKCTHSGYFIEIFNRLGDNSSSDRIFLTVLLDSIITKEEDIKFLPEVEFVSQRFQRLSDQIFKIKPDSVENFNVKEVATLLTIISHSTSIFTFLTALQKDKSLVLNCIYLLIGVHKAQKESTVQEDIRNKEADALDKIISALNDISLEEEKIPEFNFKGNIVRTLGNLSYRCREVQELIRELECLPVILECCTLDPNNPFIREWSILAIRCICEGNPANQEYIAKMKTYDPTDSKRLPVDRFVDLKS